MKTEDRTEFEYENKLETMDMESAIRIQDVLMRKLDAVSGRIQQLEQLEKQAEKQIKVERARVFLAGLGLTPEDLVDVKLYSA